MLKYGGQAKLQPMTRTESHTPGLWRTQQDEIDPGEAAPSDADLTFKWRMVASLSGKQGDHSLLKDLGLCSNYSFKGFH